MLIILGGFGAVAGGGMLTTIFKEEVTGWSKTLPGLIIRSAAKTLGEPHCARFEEEWLAELEHIPGGPVTKSLWAARIWIGRNKTAKELGESESAQRPATIHLSPANAPAVLASTDLITAGARASTVEKALLEILQAHGVTYRDLLVRGKRESLDKQDLWLRTTDGQVLLVQAKWLRNAQAPKNCAVDEG